MPNVISLALLAGTGRDDEKKSVMICSKPHTPEPSFAVQSTTLFDTKLPYLVFVYLRQAADAVNVSSQAG